MGHPWHQHSKDDGHLSDLSHLSHPSSGIIGVNLMVALDHGVMSVSSSSNPDPLSKTHYWICRQAILNAFVVELKQSDGTDMFYFTPFTSREAWIQSKGGAPLWHDDVILAPSTEQSGEANNGFLLLSHGAYIKLPTPCIRPHPTSSHLCTESLFGNPAIPSLGASTSSSGAGSSSFPPPQVAVVIQQMAVMQQQHAA